MDYIKLCAMIIFISISGCSIQPIEYTYYEEEEIENEIEDVSDQEVLTASATRSSNVQIDSYAKVAEQIMWDFRGKMHARDGFTYVPPIRKCGIEFPAQKYGHAIVAPSVGCVDVAPGHYINEATVYLPKSGGENE